MNALEPTCGWAERLGRITNQFEPGTSIYNAVVERARRMVHEARTRDDIQRVLRLLHAGLFEHLTDGPRHELVRCKAAIDQQPEPLSVQAFKESFERGTGDQPPPPDERLS